MGRGSFEEEVRRLLSKRWVTSGGTPIRTHIGGETPAGSGANTPYGNRRSGFGAAVLEEEEEDALEEMERLGGDAFGEGELAARLRTATGSSTATTSTGTSMSSSGALPSSTFTTPDLGTTSTGPTGEAAATASSAALMPVTALPTSEAETQVGLAKIAEPDVDAFMAYAAIVPEYCRLEGMLVKALV
jgi:xylulokinase